MRPGLPTVPGLVDAVADREIGPLQSLADTNVDDVGIGWTTAIAPMDPVGWSSKIGVHVRP